MSEPEYRRLSPLRIFGLVLTILAFLCLILLGNWQVRRLHWKQDLLAAVEDRLAKAPVSLAQIESLKAAGGEIEYRPVAVSGYFLHDQEKHFFATFNGQSGYYVYTPLKLDDGRFIFVNRGFVPFDMKAPSLRPEGQIDGRVTIDGLARDRLSTKPSFIVPDNDVEQNIYYWKDLDAMAARSGLDREVVLPFFIDANDAKNPGGLPVGGVTRISFPNNHLQYALTWYGLAVVLAAGVGILIFRRRRDD
ncbi:SURF1 family protein [Martelella mediterranea]|uniref:SURF1-like protein n=1 Tax=Martelella mediterranea TaxID=293089 RepID=A0A4R3NNN6_9HYPH|nr:SURF1 family protein [Martelella mediterranea]TCT37316.1 surfeit locus 1 family protein [Martelella mediterranea]